MSSNVLAVDLGTTGVKVAIVDEAGTVLAGAGEVFPIIFTADGGAEQDPTLWWDAIGRCGRQAMAASTLAAADVTIVAVTSQYTSTVAVAANGAPLSNVVMWMDQRGRRHNEAARRVAREPDLVAAWLDIHGQAPNGNDDIGHIGVIRALWPDAYDAAVAFVEPMDYVAARLTGHVTATQNTMFPMLAVDNRVWGVTEYSAELSAMSCVDVAKLPPLVPMGAPRGPITAAAAEHIGVSPRAVVTGATIDSVTSAVGTGAIDSSGCGLIVGTTSVMVTHVPTKRDDIAHGLTTSPSPLSGSYFLVAENGIGGKALDVFVNNIVHPDDGLGTVAPADAFERVIAVAAAVPPGARGVVFQPWLAGSMAPGHRRRVRGGFVNLGLSSSRADMARAVLEGVALNAAWLLPHFSALAGQSYREVSLGGGGAASAVWGQIFADCFGVPVRRLANSRTTNAHGAALLALAETGTIALADIPSMLVVAQVHEPDEGNHATYRRIGDAFIEFHDRVAPFYDLLNAEESSS